MRWTGTAIGATLFLRAIAAFADEPPPAAAQPPAAQPPAPQPPAAQPPVAQPPVAQPPGAEPLAAEPPDPELLPPEAPLPPPPAVPRRAPPAVSPLARNDWSFGLDLSVGPLPGLSQNLFGGEIAARGGYRFDTGVAFVTPEVSLAFVEIFAAGPGTSAFRGESVWVGAGARAGLRFWRLEPALFGHGHIFYTGPTPSGDGSQTPTDLGRGSGSGGVGFDVGGALDFRLTRSVALGAHAAAVLGTKVPFGIFGLHFDFTR